MIDIDKLSKLVRLANNNPNENEANLAARKVCKIIAEGNFEFNGFSSKRSNKTKQDWSGFSDFKDIFYGVDYATKKKYREGSWSEAPKYKEGSTYTYSCPKCGKATLGSDSNLACNYCLEREEIRRKVRDEQRKKEEEAKANQAKYREESAKRYEYYNTSGRDVWTTPVDAWTGEEKKASPNPTGKYTYICKYCKLTISINVEQPKPYICKRCRWERKE